MNRVMRITDHVACRIPSFTLESFLSWLFHFWPSRGGTRVRLLIFKVKQPLHQHLFGASTPVRAVPEVAAGRQITADKQGSRTAGAS
jgi:hypothetical protein